MPRDYAEFYRHLKAEESATRDARRTRRQAERDEQVRLEGHIDPEPEPVRVDAYFQGLRLTRTRF